tara:strand:- start:686 stop:1702 length:1017 start_codon:yes stop_codon:yes gene_type:complete
MSIDTITPIFITGVYRSGTTLVSRILDVHPRFAVTYDSLHYMRFCFGEFRPLSDAANRRALVEDITERCQSRWMRRLDPAPVLAELDAMTDWDDAAIYDCVMRHYLAEPEGKPQWGEKTLMAWRLIPDFLKMFPKAKTIIVLRDPRDAAASQKKITYEPGLRYLDTGFAALDAMQAAFNLELTLPASNYATVKYEDLVAAPEDVLRALCGRLEIEFDPAMLDARNFRDYSGGPWLANTSYEDDAPVAIGSTSVGRYMDFLDVADTQFLEMICRPMLAHWKYELSGELPTQEQWQRLYEIITDEFIAGRMRHWLATGEGVDVYPSAPPRVLRDEPGDAV